MSDALTPDHAEAPRADPLAGPEPTPAGEADERRGLRLEALASLALCAVPLAAGSAFEAIAGSAVPWARWHVAASTLVAGIQIAVPLAVFLRLRHGSLAPFGLGRPKLGADLGLAAAFALLAFLPYVVSESFLLQLPGAVNWGYVERPANEPARGGVDLLLAIAAGCAFGFAMSLALFGHLMTCLRRLGWRAPSAIVAVGLAHGATALGSGIIPAVQLTCTGVAMAIGYMLARRLWPLVILQSGWTAYALVFW